MSAEPTQSSSAADQATPSAPTSTPPSAPLRWGILGAGKIAATFARGLAAGPNGLLVAVASRDAAKAETFAAEHGSAEQPVAGFGSYAALLADPSVQAVYIATIHPAHHDLAVQAAAAGKHLLVEKPLAVNHAWTMAVVEAARRNEVFLAEAFMYRFHPQTRRLVELITNGAIGEVLQIEASFGFRTNADATSRLLDPATAGGGILDVGGYPVSMARLLAGAATGQAFADPIELTGVGTLGSTGVDEWSVARLVFASGVGATVSTGIRAAGTNDVRVLGSKGYLVVPQPWLPPTDGPATFELTRIGEDVETITIDPVNQYTLEADAVAAGVAAGRREAPEMSWGDTLGNAQTLDRWRTAIDLSYPSEADDADYPVVRARPAGVNHDRGAMRYGRLAGVDKNASRLVMGVDNQRTVAHASVMFDDFAERGGNVFDTAYIYGGGRMEQMLGRWVANRGIRDDVVILGKGLHTPSNNPESFRPQLERSLENLRTDHLDVYLPHRDNVDIPVGEFIDAFNEAADAGLVRSLGASNWTINRFVEANRYAAAHGKRGLTALSNHFGLAHALDVPWKGCEHVTDPASRAWLTESQTTLLPWSSQARGFFVREFDDPGTYGDPDLARCYHSEANVERRQRARKLAAELDVPTTAIALAYVLDQPFPTFPLIGPRSLEETRSSLRALDITLSPDQVAWLDLRS